MYRDYDDYNDSANRRNQFEKTKRWYEDHGYIVSDYGEVRCKSRPWDSGGFIDEDGEYHSYM